MGFEPNRPLYGRVACDNYGAHQVFATGGFVQVGPDQGFTQARQRQMEEYMDQLTT